MNRRVLRWGLTTGYCVAAAAGIAWALRGTQWHEAGELVAPRALPFLLLAAAVNVAGICLGMVAWRGLLTGLAGPVPARPASRLYFISFLGKFVPGRVWTLLAQIRLADSVGVRPAQITATFGLSLAVVTVTGLVAGALIAPSLGAGAAWLALPAGVFALGLARPGWVAAPLLWASRLVKRELTLPADADRRLRVAMSVQLLCWGVSGLHLWLLAVVLGADPLRALPAAVGGFALAMVAGSYAIVVPDGAGVREVLLALVLGSVLPPAAVGVAVVASRLLCLVTEVVTALAVCFGHMVRTRIEVSHADTAERPGEAENAGADVR
ncbi:lysylphosphatidylglycerol synthase domain-containing protein [Streptomyces sp. YIM 98790]|uniref:lysylphosphatidylglycerol synthase domain-containing protein n=1 Tax=Streptomyces sp. YIM 98790 TaxID=2689077 RepID=UPI00140E77A1|nr:lysylphosphatidylglycerol synthase domain-containing protein [Streptomyces sp. YIM 98790]